MSIFGNIMSGIFSHGSAKVQPTSTGNVAPNPTSASSSTVAATSAAAPPSQVDVEAVLSRTYTATSMNEIWYSKQWDNAPMPHSIFFIKDGHAIHGSYDLKNLGKPVSH